MKRCMCESRGTCEFVSVFWIQTQLNSVQDQSVAESGSSPDQDPDPRFLFYFYENLQKNFLDEKPPKSTTKLLKCS